ncbi:MAG: type II toxin-antitoxin system PemK/MazF family toxin [Marivivens sp.]|uniref:type II toxin-antitoxin system PemK/MazF family toxin n=1 Tax=Marivivens sp. TaxID=1978374 RepID=UPI0017EC31DE|nr:type II toxin-antitoxin system PemK/MazF family toxin [Marivivens sp.]NVJ96268.1 type II toxin-antitoxin system PemK/MazF family toxin [Marivivens sp.]
MALSYSPKKGTIITANFSSGFKEPEMVKRRLAVVVSPPIQARRGLCTVVPLSLSEPNRVMQYHMQLDIPFELPEPWGNVTRWVKGDMICALGWHRLDLLRLGKGDHGKRLYQTETLNSEIMDSIHNCVLFGLGLNR